MNLYKIEQLKAEAIARCRKRLEMHGKTDVILPSGSLSYYSLRKKHGLCWGMAAVRSYSLDDVVLAWKGDHEGSAPGS